MHVTTLATTVSHADIESTLVAVNCAWCEGRVLYQYQFSFEALALPPRVNTAQELHPAGVSAAPSPSARMVRS